MKKSDSRPAKVTEEHQQESARLKKLWKERSKFTQEAFGVEFGIGTQGAVWRFLNGRDPLSAKAARGFARGLNVQIGDFSPRLAHEAVEAAGLVELGSAPDLTRLARGELQLVELYRGLPATHQPKLLEEARRLYVQARTPADPPKRLAPGSLVAAKKKTPRKHA